MSTIPTLKYEEAGPRDASKRIYMIHGYGANEHDLISLSESWPDCHCVSFRAPYSLGCGSGVDQRAWFLLEWSASGAIDYSTEDLDFATNCVLENIKAYEAKHAVEEVYLLGFSQGAIIAHQGFLENSALFTGLFGLSARFTESVFNTKVLEKQNLDGKKILLSHGFFDDVIPYASGQQIQRFYEENKIEHSFVGTNNGHGIDQKCIDKISAILEAN